jgi:PAS domain S-box-containing protein
MTCEPYSLYAGFFAKLFDTGFMPHVYCLRIPQVIWLHVVSDALIAIAYALIPLGLLRLLKKRSDLSFHWMFLLFAVFILSCGATHVLAIVTLWVPIYRFEGLAKLITAFSSIATAILLFRVIPQIANMPSPEQWRRSNQELQTEIADRKRAEAKYRDLLEAAPDAVVVVNPEGKIVLVNSQVERLFEYRREEVMGQPIEMLVPAAEPGEDSAYPQGSPSDSTRRPGRRGLEARAVRKDGTQFPVEISLSSLETEEGLLISSTIRDLTERKRAERTREQLAESVAANRTSSAFLSTMSHEIRTPMNAILGYAQLMSRDAALGTEAKTNLKIISQSGEHLLSIIDDVLDMSKAEAGGTDLKPVSFSLPRMLADLAATFSLRAAEKALRFEVLSDGEALPLIVADENKIKRVLINLLGNAVKFTQRGLIKMHASVEHRPTDQFWLAVRVVDTGVGLTNEEQGKLFQPFTQTSRGVYSHEGIGLGLAIGRKYARMMGGDITLTSNPGEGSIFSFEVPVERGQAGEAVGRDVPRRVRSLRAGSSVPNILVADDQVENRDWLITILTGVGFCVRVADNGEAAIRSWEQWCPQLILMSVDMPVMDGLEATRRIKADPRGKETVIVTLIANVPRDDGTSISQSGADDFLAKPFGADELLEKIRVHLDVGYDYEEVKEPEAQPSTAAVELNADALRQVPRELIEELRNATLGGNKRRLDKLILQVAGTEGSAVAGALKEAADKYQYDTLTLLLEEASQR